MTDRAPSAVESSEPALQPAVMVSGGAVDPALLRDSSPLQPGLQSQLLAWLHPGTVGCGIILGIAARVPYWFTLADVLALMIGAWLVMALLWALCRGLAGNAAAASAAATVLIVGFLLGGEAQTRLANRGMSAGAATFLVWTLWLAGLTLVVATRRHWPGTEACRRFGMVLTLTGLLITFRSIAVLILAALAAPNFSEPVAPPAAVTAALDPVALRSMKPVTAASHPDIYWIILDGYGRDDVLREDCDFDNTPFLNGLRARGYFIADRAFSSYPLTAFSLSTTLSLQHVVPPLSSQDLPRAFRSLQEHRTRRWMQSLGYRLGHFQTNWVGTMDAPRADLRFGRPALLSAAVFDTLRRLGSTSLLRSERASWWASHERFFRELPEIIAKPGPKFVFAHLICPHPPSVYRADGTWRPETNETTAAYIAQLEGLNRRLQPILDALDAQAKREPDRPEPIVLLQSDHGPWLSPGWDDSPKVMRSRLAMLNAVKGPPALLEKLSPDSSPLNTFRAVLSVVFDVPLPPVPDRYFLATYDHLERTVEVTEPLRNTLDEGRRPPPGPTAAP